MKKNMIALAVATAFAAPAVMAEATLYGLANLTVWQASGDEVDDSGTGEIGISSVASRIGVKGSNDLGDGLKAVYQMEFQIDMANGSGINKNRNNFVGLAGGFGTVMLGQLDTPNKSAMGKVDMFADTAGDMSSTTVDITGDQDDANWAGTIDGEVRAKNSLTYVSPKFEGVQVAVQMSGATTDNEDRGTSYSITYTGVEGLTVALSGDKDIKGAQDTLADRNALSVVYKVDNMQFGLIHEMNDFTNWDEKATTTLVNASYKMDKMTIAAQYAKSDSNDNDWYKSSNATIGVKYGFNKSTTGYAAYNSRKTDDSWEEASAWQVGLMTKF
jgi:predicted porin